MIPKVIHYCWFGGNPLPELAKKCIASWKKYCPDYELKLWNEENFDLNCNAYVKEAYEAKKFAFVTDYVRLWVLYNYGGVYMDTDVEVLKPLDRFLVHPAFSGFESPKIIPTGIIASEQNGVWVKEELEYYKNLHFKKDDGSYDLTANVIPMTQHFVARGGILNNAIQDHNGIITLYPVEFFCPMISCRKIIVTDNTYTIHHFAGSWLPWHKKVRKDITQFLLNHLPLLHKILLKTKRFFIKRQEP